MSFKQEVVRQIVKRGHSAAEGIRTHRRVGARPVQVGQGCRSGQDREARDRLVEAKSEILRLRAQLRRTEEERDILRGFVRQSSSDGTACGR